MAWPVDASDDESKRLIETLQAASNTLQRTERALSNLRHALLALGILVDSEIFFQQNMKSMVPITSCSRERYFEVVAPNALYECINRRWRHKS